MAGFFGIIGDSILESAIERVARSIDPLCVSQTRLIRFPRGIIGISLHRARLKSHSSLYMGERYIFCFGGDIVSFNSSYWKIIEHAIYRADYSCFDRFRGLFAIGIVDKKENNVYIISDRTSQYPIFYTLLNNSFIFSTTLATFCMLIKQPTLNKTWLYEYMFFNYPIEQNTFIKNVLRMPPASILRFNAATFDYSIQEYAMHFDLNDDNSAGKYPRETALETVRSVVPKYYDGSAQFAHGLTAGFDTRALLSLMPADKRESAVMYTYGIPGCMDISDAATITKKLRLRHHIILLNDEFLQQLPRLVYETVFISGGLENIYRSYLPFALQSLCSATGDLQYIVSGISPPPFCKITSHGMVNTSVLSYHMQEFMLRGNLELDQSNFHTIFEKEYLDFAHHISSIIGSLVSRYGKGEALQKHFDIYEINPKYFAGELSITDQFTALRMPFFDSEIIQSCFPAQFGSSSRNFLLKGPSPHDCCRAFLFSDNPDLKNVPVHLMPPRAYCCESKLIYNYYRYFFKLPTIISRMLKKTYPPPPLDNWQVWISGALKNTLSDLLSENSLACNYIHPRFIRNAITEGNAHIIKLLSTLEILLRLINSNWRL